LFFLKKLDHAVTNENEYNNILSTWEVFIDAGLVDIP